MSAIFQIISQLATIMYRHIYITDSRDYVISAIGSICFDIGKPSILNENECRKAATLVGKNFRNAEENAYYPRGCYCLASTAAYWNFHKTGNKQPDTAEICQGAGMNIFISSIFYIY